jgi:hypothetical protein
VVETGLPEAVLELPGQPLIRAQHHACDQRRPLAVETGCDPAADEPAEPIGDATEPSPAAELVPAAPVQDDVHALAAEPGSFVEAVLRRPRLLRLGDRLDHGPLGRRSPERQLE